MFNDVYTAIIASIYVEISMGWFIICCATSKKYTPGFAESMIVYVFPLEM